MARIYQGLILLFSTVYGSSALVCYSCQTWYNPTGSPVWNLFIQPDNAACKAGTSNATATGCDVCLYQDATLTLQLTSGGSTSVSLYQRGCIKAAEIPNFDKSTVPKDKCVDASGYKDDPLTVAGFAALKFGFNSAGGSASSVSATGISCMCNDKDKCNDKEPTGAGAGDLKSSPLLMSVLMLISLLVSCKMASR